MAPHELEREAEEDGGDDGDRAAARRRRGLWARARGRGLRGTCVLFGAALPMYI